MTLDPRISMWISIVAAVLAFTGASTAELTTFLSPHAANLVVGACAFFGGLINAINAVLHMIPSQSGPVGAAQFPLGPKT
jgi:hypothetical protein